MENDNYLSVALYYVYLRQLYYMYVYIYTVKRLTFAEFRGQLSTKYKFRGSICTSARALGHRKFSLNNFHRSRCIREN